MSQHSCHCIVCGPAGESRNDISYHTFPKNKEEEWLNFFGLTLKTIRFKIQRARLCSQHFTPDDFSCLEDGRKRFLKRNAVPTVFFVDEAVFMQRKAHLCDFDKLSEAAESSSIDRITNAGPKKKYADFAKTCLICRRQRGSNLSYFSFPKGSMREAWVDASQRTEPIPKNALLCSRHFERCHYANPPEAPGRTTLKRNAIPTKFLPKSTDGSNRCGERLDAENLSSRIGDAGALECDRSVGDLNVTVQDFSVRINKVGSCEDDESCGGFENAVPRASTPTRGFISTPSIQQRVYDRLSDQTNFFMSTRTSRGRRNWKPRYPGDIGKQHTKTLRRAREIIKFMKGIVERQRREIHNLRKKVARRNVKIANLVDAVEQLQKPNVLAANEAEHLMTNMEIKQEPEDDLIEEFKIEFEEHLTGNEIIGDFLNNEEKDIELSSKVKNELVSIKQENETDLQVDSLLQSEIEITDDEDIKCNSIQIIDNKQSKKESSMKGNNSGLVKMKDELSGDGTDSENGRLFKCEFCSKTFSVKRSLLNHERIHNYPDAFKCEICSKSVINRDALNVHMRIHAGEKPFQCQICSRSFTAKSSFVRHSRIHSPSDAFKCEICPKSFIDRKYLTKHMRCHTGEKPFVCEICSKLFTDKRYLVKHQRIHAEQKPYKCEFCLKSFNDKYNYNRHKRWHTGEKPFKCDVCSKSFTAKSNLIQHSRLHTEEKPFKCKMCTKSFKLRIRLVEHASIHSEQKPFKCEICSKSFTAKSSFVKHARIHSPSDAFKCEICSKYFIERSHLNAHMRCHTGEKPFQCEICSKSFAIKYNLVRHARIHTREAKFVPKRSR